MGWTAPADEIVAKPWTAPSDELVNEPSKLKSAILGAGQGASMNFGDEGAAGIETMAKAGKDLFGGKVDPQALLDYYRKSRDQIRGNIDTAQKANPKTFMAGEFGGAAATAPLMGEATIPKMMGLGAVQGLGASKADLTQGDVGGAARDTAIGAGMGAAIAGMGKAAGWLGGKAIDSSKWAIKKALSSFLGPSEEAIEARLADPLKIANAKSYAELAQDLPGSVNKISDQLSKDSTNAWKTLSTSHDPLKGAIPKDKIVDMINKAKLDPQITGGGTFGPASKKAISVLNGLVDDIGNVGNKVSGKIKSEMGVPSILRNKDFISETQLKQLVQSLDENTNWDDPAAEPLNKSLQSLRVTLDGVLKSQNKNYETAMEPVAAKTDLLQKLKRGFNLKTEPGEGFVPTDTTASKMQTVTGEKKPVSQDLLEELKNLTGRDYLSESKTYNLAKQFEGGKANGSRSVNQMAAIGGGIGAATGSMLGMPGTGGAIGATAGAATGSYIDKQGGKMAGSLIDWYTKNNPAVLGKYAPIFQKAMQSVGGGSQEVAIKHWALSQTDPEYRDMIKNLPDQPNQ